MPADATLALQLSPLGPCTGCFPDTSGRDARFRKGYNQIYSLLLSDGTKQRNLEQGTELSMGEIFSHEYFGIC